MSHTWASGGWSKALSLLMQSGCHVALIFSFFGHLDRTLGSIVVICFSLLLFNCLASFSAGGLARGVFHIKSCASKEWYLPPCFITQIFCPCPSDMLLAQKGFQKYVHWEFWWQFLERSGHLWVWRFRPIVHAANRWTRAS